MPLSEENNKYQLFDDNLDLFSSMLKDISLAKKTIFLEIYRFGQDSMGEKFRHALLIKAKEGVKIKILIDAWGSGSDVSFFGSLINEGVSLRVYKKMNFEKTYFVKNHCRNHRKLLLIDGEIAYIGSSNITAYSLNWRELNFRIEELGLIKLFTRSFNDSFRSYNKYSFVNIGYKRDLHFGSWLFIQDIPNSYRQRIKKRYEHLLESAKKEIIIETPYFLPGHKLRKKLCEAAEKGLTVRIMTPFHSDVRLVDILRRKYLGELHLSGVELCFYDQGNLHAKGLMIDNELFSISSANFDYRSFRYQYEIALIGKEKIVVDLLKEHFDKTYTNCVSFNYENWQKRSRIEKFFEWLLLPIRYLF